MQITKGELPVHGQAGGEAGNEGAEEPSCGPKVYVSNEEAALLSAIRGLRERGMTLRRQLEQETDEVRREEIEARLDALRDERRELVERREHAFLRKMVMLGHLPARVLDEPES